MFCEEHHKLLKSSNKILEVSSELDHPDIEYFPIYRNDKLLDFTETTTEDINLKLERYKFLNSIL